MLALEFVLNKTTGSFLAIDSGILLSYGISSITFIFNAFSISSFFNSYFFFLTLFKTIPPTGIFISLAYSTNLAAITLTDAPSPTFVVINFSVTDPDGAVNLNNDSAALNLTKAGEELRYNSSCAVKDYSGNYANYTCNVTMWWWDAAGSWTVYANITDLGANLAINGTHTVTVNSLKGFVMSPSALTFSSMNAGTTNQTPTNNILMNNTGNVDIASNGVQINATDLVGETNADKFLWAGNFSASPYTGGNIECNITASATAMANMSYTAVTNTILAAGNYTIGDGTAQEKVYLCLREAGVELTQQQYSTDALGSWTVKIV